MVPGVGVVGIIAKGYGGFFSRQRNVKLTVRKDMHICKYTKNL